MSSVNNSERENTYWSQRYLEGRVGWDIGYPSTPIKEYVDQLEDKSIHILIPGAGNAYEAEYLHHQGFTNVYILDISKQPLNNFQVRNPDFPEDHLVHGNFFTHQGQYDLIFEQTFFCSFPPTKENRSLYSKKMGELIKPRGKLVGVWFDIPLTGDMEKRPFGGDREEYLAYLSQYFKVKIFERCHNSIPPRAGNELFGVFEKTSGRIISLD